MTSLAPHERLPEILVVSREKTPTGAAAPKDKKAMQESLMKLSSEMGMDFSVQRDDMYRRMRRLICFDMDSTLIQTECIDELAERNGVGAEVRAITESAMRGEIDFKESFTRRVALLKGLDVSVMQDIAENLPITEGADRLMSVLKTYGYTIAILSNASDPVLSLKSSSSIPFYP